MLDTIDLVARLVLAAVFTVAALAKLADRTGTRQAVVNFGAPERVAGALAIVIPLAELTVALLLLPAATAAAGAVGALALLTLFSGAIAVSLVRGEAPDCHCFGQLHSAPASWRTLARNAALAGVAVVALGGALATTPTSATAWIARLDGAELLALAVAVSAVVLLAVGAFAFLTLMRSYGNVLVRLDRVEAALADAGIEVDPLEHAPEIGMAPGTRAPAFSARSLTGDRVTLGSLTASEVPTLLLFTSPHCGPCKTLLPTASQWQDEYRDILQIVFVTDGARDDARTEAEEFALEHVVLDEQGSLSAAFEASGTPSAVLVAPDGTIGSWVAPGSEWIERLVADATAEPPEDAGLPVGSPAPDVALTTLEGERVTVSELHGHDTLLLFWNPGCGFCRSMHEDLLAWEESGNGNSHTPELVVVSAGDAESSRAEGFRSRVWLDEDFSAGSAFGAGGTPMAVLIDADGRIASGVAAGAEAVLALVRTEPA